MSSRLLWIGFLSPAIIAVLFFFLLPVLLTVVFSFTTMSTATGILGGAYRLDNTQLRALGDTDISPASIERIERAGFLVTEAGLVALAEQFDPPHCGRASPEPHGREL